MCGGKVRKKQQSGWLVLAFMFALLIAGKCFIGTLFHPLFLFRSLVVYRETSIDALERCKISVGSQIEMFTFFIFTF